MLMRLARITTTSRGSTLRQPLKMRTWVIDRCRIYKLVARANRYSWDNNEASEVIGEKEGRNGPTFQLYFKPINRIKTVL